MRGTGLRPLLFRQWERRVARAHPYFFRLDWGGEEMELFRRGISRLSLRGWHRLHRWLDEERCEGEVDIELRINNACNLSCEMCGDKPGPDQLNLEQLQQYRFLSRARTARIVSGEPLLHPAWPELVETLARRVGRHRVRLNTNGVLLQGKSLHSLARTRIAEITISHDGNARFGHGLGEESHHRRIRENVRKMMAIRQGRYPELWIWHVVAASNQDEVAEWLGEYSRWGVTGVALLPLCPKEDRGGIWGKEFPDLGGATWGKWARTARARGLRLLDRRNWRKSRYACCDAGTNGWACFDYVGICYTIPPFCARAEHFGARPFYDSFPVLLLRKLLARRNREWWPISCQRCVFADYSKANFDWGCRVSEWQPQENCRASRYYHEALEEMKQERWERGGMRLLQAVRHDWRMLKAHAFLLLLLSSRDSRSLMQHLVAANPPGAIPSHGGRGAGSSRWQGA